MKVTFIGLGTMGAGMANNILKAGHELTVHNRTREKEEILAAEGVRRAASPREAASGAEIIVSQNNFVFAIRIYIKAELSVSKLSRRAIKVYNKRVF